MSFYFFVYHLCFKMFLRKEASSALRREILQFLFLIPLEKCDGRPLQYSCLKNPMGGGAWWAAAVHGVTKSRTQLSDFTFIFHFHALEKEMATHSRVLAWRIPGTGEPGGLHSPVYGVAQSRTRLKRLSSSSREMWAPQ